MPNNTKHKITAKRVILTSLVVDVVDITLNVTVAIITGSVVMLAEALQGIADLAAVIFLYIGLKKSRRKPNKKYQFGFGKEIYFWTLVSGFIIFAITATLSFYFGWQEFWNPEPIEHITLAYVVLTIAVITNGYSFSLSFRRLLDGNSRKQIIRIFLETPFIESKTTFILDLMGTLAAITGLTALALYGLTGILHFDGIGAMAIGVMLALLAIVLLIGVKELIVGKSSSPKTQDKIEKSVLSIPEVLEVLDLRTMIIGTEKILVNIEVHLRDDLNTNQIEEIIDRIKDQVREDVPTIQHIQVELETP